ncbi:MAG: ABC transporter permease [Candidatus Gastranaerophilales bacterium]|nr:ABC transporter permease [Candidatus Gastranaerophilales bacterium]
MASLLQFNTIHEENLIKSLLKDKFARYAFFILLFLYLAVFSASFISPYLKDYSNRDKAYCPPSKIYLINEKGKLSFPYTYNYIRYFDKESFETKYIEDKTRKYKVKYFARGKGYKLFGFIPFNRHFYDVEEGGELYLLGTDINGRDNFSRLLYGGQISLTIGFLALLVSFPLGMLYGGLSGYFGGKTDFIMMRTAEAIMSIPSFYLLIILASILPANMTSVQRFTLIVLILALIGWAGFSRVVRGMVLSIKQKEFVIAAEAIGTSNMRIIIRHILPQTLSYVIVAMTLSVPSYILSESGLSFLGLGIQQPDASWGNMLKEAQEFINIISRPWLLTPGFLIFVAVLSFNVIGDTIRDILDPNSRER